MNTQLPYEPTDVGMTEDKTAAIVSYLTLIGFVAAVIVHGNKKTRLGAFHLRQSLGLMLLWIALGFCWVIPILGWILGFAGWLVLAVVWVMGFIGAIKGEMKPVPLLGERFQQWFGTAFD